MNQTIGQRIRECRVNRGLTQEQLAEMMCITSVQISHYENDRNDIKVSVLKELAKHLKVSSTYLLEGETECFDEEVTQMVMMLQEMPAELRKVALEQVKLLNGICTGNKY